MEKSFLLKIFLGMLLWFFGLPRVAEPWADPRIQAKRKVEGGASEKKTSFHPSSLTKLVLSEGVGEEGDPGA